MKRSLLFILIISFFIAGYIGYPYYKIYRIKDQATFENVSDDVILYLPKNETLKVRNLSEFLKKSKIISNEADYVSLAEFKKIADKKIPFKKIKLLKKWNTYNSLLNNINYAIDNHKEVNNVIFNNSRTIEDIAGKVSKFINADSTELSNIFNNDSIIKHYGFNKHTWPTFFLPNTYECYTDISPEAFIQLMATEYKKYWNKDRMQKAKNINLSQSEVTILASIVLAEQRVNYDEHDTIAGIYINRLKKGMFLESCPTVIYAHNDFSMKRVLNKHLEIESPYNTYRNPGLPPGPICIPDPRVIDAVLNYQDHDYLFMCAKPGYTSSHYFSITNAQHERHSREYAKWADKEGIN